MRILALDLGDTTGFTRPLQGLVPIETGIVDLSVLDGEHPGARWPRARGVLRKLMTGCTHVAWERIISGGRGQGAYAKASLFGLEVQVVELCAELELESITVAPASLKKFATGSGRATKGEMREAGRVKWPGVEFATHDAVDARWVYEWARAALSGKAVTSA